MIPGMASIMISMPLFGRQQPERKNDGLSRETEFRFGVMRFTETAGREFRAV